jgi:hypothetical protein
MNNVAANAMAAINHPAHIFPPPARSRGRLMQTF